MADSAIVSVRGEARLEVEPEIATLSVTLRVVERHRDDAVARLTKRQAALTALLNEHSDAIERRHTAAMWVNPKIKGRDERQTGYAATLRTTILVADLSVIGELATTLSSFDDASFEGPRWALRDESPVYRDARIAAAKDSLARARDYASALGSEILSLLELADQGLMTEAVTARPEPMLLGGVARGAMHSAPEPTLDLEPARQIVRATVEARYRMSAPALA